MDDRVNLSLTSVDMNTQLPRVVFLNFKNINYYFIFFFYEIWLANYIQLLFSPDINILFLTKRLTVVWWKASLLGPVPMSISVQNELDICSI